MKQALIIDTIVFLLFIMFIYTGFSKCFDFEGYKVAMHNQPFPDWLSDFLIWVLPPVEITIAGLLFFEKTRRNGLWASMMIMLLFTLYIVLILFRLFPKVPCSCGGVIKSLTWTQHLFFNLFFLTISFIGYKLQPYQEITNKKASDKNISRAKSG